MAWFTCSHSSNAVQFPTILVIHVFIFWNINHGKRETFSSHKWKVLKRERKYIIFSYRSKGNSIQNYKPSKYIVNTGGEKKKIWFSFKKNQCIQSILEKHSRFIIYMENYTYEYMDLQFPLMLLSVVRYFLNFLMGIIDMGKELGVLCTCVCVCLSMFGFAMKRRKGVMEFSMYIFSSICTICVRLNISVSPYILPSYLLLHCSDYFSACVWFRFWCCYIFYQADAKCLFLTLSSCCLDSINWHPQIKVRQFPLPLRFLALARILSLSLFLWFSLCCSLLSRLHKIKIINHEKICKFVIGLVASIFWLKMKKSSGENRKKKQAKALSLSA